MSLQSSSELWDGVTFWLTVFGTALLFASVVTGIEARRYVRRLSEEKSQQAERDKRAHDQAIAQLGKETAEANKIAEQERTARLKLEVLIQPRYLKKEEELEIETAMRQFSGHNLLIASQWVDLEAASLAKQLKSCLNRAGIGIGDTFSNATIDKIGAYPEIFTGMLGGGGGTVGPKIRSGIEIWGVDRAAVNALANVLKKTFQTVSIPPQSANPFAGTSGPREFATMSLIVFVGSKPIPDMK